MKKKLATRRPTQDNARAQQTSTPSQIEIRRPSSLPLGALMLAASFSAVAQTTAQPPSSPEQVMPAVDVKGQQETLSKESFRTTTTGIGKGNQELRDIPQSVTVMTERLMDDRNLDDFREVLRTTAGVTFQAGETGEEDVRLRGFSLGQAGDIYTDGMRDAALYERDTFNNDRIEVLKGSASMLFGKGSTGGVVNQVNKTPFLFNQNEVTYTLGTGELHRLTGDFNIKTGDDAALRLNAMVHNAENWGARQKKFGIAPTYSWGIGTRDEFTVGLFHLRVEGRPLYNHPWFLSGGTRGEIIETLPAKNYYGLASDYLDTQATYGTVGHVHRFDNGSQLKTTLRHGRYERDLWASVIRFGTGTTPGNLSGATVINRTPKGRIGVSDTTQLSSDFTGNFNWGGRNHSILAGVDVYNEDAKRDYNSIGTPVVAKPNTTVGRPNDGASVADTRIMRGYNNFDARNIGLYLQDMVSVTPTVKLLGGLRFDHFEASYVARDGVSFKRNDNLWSPRVGALFQPSDVASYYASFGTSYNTSGDTYQFAVNSPNLNDARTPAEKSRNLEVGGKWELFEKRASLGVAAFYSEKYNERNTDEDSAATQQLLSGKRHATGMEFNLAGRITPKWEVFFNHTWIPNAKIDKSNVARNAAGTGAQVEGDRPGLTPKHSSSLWTTYRVLPALRLGAGLTYRGEQNPEGARHVTAGSFTVFDAMAEYTINETWTAKLNVTNLTDRLYADSLYRGFYAPGAPRRVELTLKAMF
ncbi:MAG TPA: TonB-dependent siderophore receptor [Noviherbaspirillum sp.]|jgi:catecholate siderophore receptor|uniref:TonB-dependent receptor n=1 Tax=Noviherbaspirillum sp. TaxID=1926288 RepID=UPI002DDD7A3D|nr:TonB-dependent siderophore receptor [Noviherbaspirillum sp.]HEV2612899.1 TonB-dependent siderophore receptor [Noviherbaspirillum sp.]